MRVFLDTNVILDLIQERVGCDEAALIMQKSYNGDFFVFTSTLSMVNVAYILRKHYRGESLYHLLEELMNIIRLITVSSEAYQQALQSRASDFEDVRIPVDTRSPIPVISVQSVGDLQYHRQN